MVLVKMNFGVGGGGGTRRLEVWPHFWDTESLPGTLSEEKFMARPLDLSAPADALWMALAEGSEEAALDAIANGADSAEPRPADWDHSANQRFMLAFKRRGVFSAPAANAGLLTVAAACLHERVVERILELRQDAGGLAADSSLKEALSAVLLMFLPVEDHQALSDAQGRIANRLHAEFRVSPWEEPQMDAGNPTAPVASPWAQDLFQKLNRANDADWSGWKWLASLGKADFASPLSIVRRASDGEPQIAAVIGAAQGKKGLSSLRAALRRAKEDQSAAGGPTKSPRRHELTLARVALVEQLAREQDNMALWHQTPSAAQLEHSALWAIAKGDTALALKNLRALHEDSLAEKGEDLIAVFQRLWSIGGPAEMLPEGADATPGWEASLRACSGTERKNWLPVLHLHGKSFADQTQTQFWKNALLNLSWKSDGLSASSMIGKGAKMIENGDWALGNFWNGAALCSHFNMQKIAQRELNLEAQSGRPEAMATRAQQKDWERRDARSLALAIAFIKPLLDNNKSFSLLMGIGGVLRKLSSNGHWFLLDAALKSGALSNAVLNDQEILFSAVKSGRASTAEALMNGAWGWREKLEKNPKQIDALKQLLPQGAIAFEERMTQKTKAGKTIAAKAAGKLHGDWAALETRIDALDFAASLRAEMSLETATEADRSNTKSAEKARRI